jgi:Cys-tRNA(Pro) deacylase
VAKDKTPVTTGLRELTQKKAVFTPRLYAYEERGGTAVAARELGVDEHEVVKTLVMEAEGQGPLMVLMHGDRQVSTRALARQIGARGVSPLSPEAVTKLTGYQVGGVSPFGVRRALPVYVEEGILALPRLFINAGKRGFLVEMAPAELTRLLAPKPVSVAVEG